MKRALLVLYFLVLHIDNCMSLNFNCFFDYPHSMKNIFENNFKTSFLHWFICVKFHIFPFEFFHYIGNGNFRLNFNLLIIYNLDLIIVVVILPSNWESGCMLVMLTIKMEEVWLFFLRCHLCRQVFCRYLFEFFKAVKQRFASSW